MAAYSQGGDKAVMKEVFSYEFSCLQLMKNKSKYKKLLGLLSEEERLVFCNPDNKKYRVYSPNGGILRSAPSSKSKRISAIPVGNIVICVGQEGVWKKVYSKWGTGYMHESIFKYRFQ